MLVEKPEAVRHENAAGNAAAIYGVDAHPSKRLFATAGGDGSVKIWSLQTSSEDGVATFELLATLAFHEQAVNCVRWAAHGRYLASGSDDHLVLLYELHPGAPPPVPFGSNAKPNKQNWTRCSTLKRHTMDVQDLAWSPDDRLLATCSIDNTICIWDVDPTGVAAVMSQPLHTLTGHNGWVKGVAWDPVGKYLTSAGEDKTVRVWRVDSWQEAQVISEPFEACASTSNFRRLSWSPDGAVLSATHGFKSKKNIAALLDRSSWSNDVDFVGHQGVVTCTRFNPKLFEKDCSSDKEYACCAVGGDDATISIWLSHMARPLTVVKDCFDASVTDLTWSVQEGRSMLIASSLDGTVCCFQLDPDETGSAVSDVRQSKLLQSKYGSRAGITLASTFVENPLQLQLEEKTQPRVKPPQAQSTTAAATHTLIPKKKGASSSGGINVLQAVSKKGDRKRISPVLMPDNRSDETPAPDSAGLNAASVANKIQNILGPTVPDNLGDTSLLDDRMVGKPTKTSEQDANNPASSAKNATTSASASKTELKRHRDSSLKRKREGERGVPKAGNAGAAIMAKSKEVTPRQPKVLTNRESGGASSSEPLLPQLPFRLSFSVEFDSKRDAASSTSSVLVDVTVHNVKTPNDSEAVDTDRVYSTVRCSEQGEMRWIDRFPGRVVCVTGNANVCAMGTSSGDLFVLSLSGRRLFPCIALGCSIAVMECSPLDSGFLMVILSSGAVRIWDVTQRKIKLNDSIEAVVSSAYTAHQRVTLLRSTVTPTGHPMITFAISNPEMKGSSSLNSYTFDDDMATWMRVADDSFVYSDFKSSLVTDAVVAHDIPMGPLRRLQNASGFSRTQRGVASVMLKELPDPVTQRNVTRAHLEHQLATSVVLKSPQEYLYWLKAYVRFLSVDEDVPRLEEFCAEMLGPFHSPSQALNDGRHQVLGFARRELLRAHILPTMASNRTLQRVVAKYQLMLSEIDGSAA